MKKCSKCKSQKPFEEFGKNKNKKDGLHHYCKNCRKTWGQTNLVKISNYCKLWREKNPEKIKSSKARRKQKNPNYQKEWAQANREKVLETKRKWQKKWRQQNPELAKKRWKNWAKFNQLKIQEKNKKWRELNVEKVKSCYKKWAKKNVQKTRFNNHRRRAFLKNAVGFDYTTLQHINWRWEMWGNKCWMCSSEATETDHVIPLRPKYRKQNGTHWPSNLRPACKSCNSNKSNKQTLKNKTNII